VTGGQIKFPATQNPSAAVNTLDDYEEGTWTPVIGGAVSTTGQSYTAQEGAYVKIGKLVIAQFRVLLSNKGTITGAVQIQGFPFTADSGFLVLYSQSMALWDALSTNWVNINLIMTQATAVADVRGTQAAAVTNNTGLAASDISNTTTFSGTL